MPPRSAQTIASGVRAFLDRHEVLLVRPSGPEIHTRNIAQRIYAPVRTLSSRIDDGLVIVDRLYPEGGVPLRFELDPAPDLGEGARLDGEAIAPGETARLEVPPTRRRGQLFYELRLERPGGASSAFRFECLEPTAWRGSHLADPLESPPAVPLCPPQVGLGPPGEAGERALAFLDLVLAGDLERAYSLCAPVYRLAVAYGTFAKRLAQFSKEMADRPSEDERLVVGSVDRHPSSVFARIARSRPRAPADPRAVEAFLTIAPGPGGFEILEAQLRAFAPQPEEAPPRPGLM